MSASCCCLESSSPAALQAASSAYKLAGKSQTCLFFLNKHSNRKNRERGSSSNYVHVIKTALQVKQSHLYSNSYFKEDLD